MNNSKLEEYAVIDAQIKHLTKQKDELKLGVIEELIQSGENSVTIAVGQFTLANLKTWTYTPKCKEMEEQFKAQKAMEQSTGDATFEEKSSLRFSAVKF
ncbi:MAG: hypothetical protein KAS32_12520 [Candidatus Peribacteraceae bacterium]|nr:hypothetical protein [Candidatus Peribacteraceae bacterium]